MKISTTTLIFSLFASMASLMACSCSGAATTTTPQHLLAPMTEMTLAEIKQLYEKLFPPFLGACDLKDYHLSTNNSPFPLLKPTLKLFWESSFAPVCEPKKAFFYGNWVQAKFFQMPPDLPQRFRQETFKIKFYLQRQAFTVRTWMVESYLPRVHRWLEAPSPPRAQNEHSSHLLFRTLNPSKMEAFLQTQGRMALDWLEAKLQYQPTVTLEMFVRWIMSDCFFHPWEGHQRAPTTTTTSHDDASFPPDETLTMMSWVEVLELVVDATRYFLQCISLHFDLERKEIGTIIMGILMALAQWALWTTLVRPYTHPDLQQESCFGSTGKKNKMEENSNYNGPRKTLWLPFGNGPSQRGILSILNHLLWSGVVWCRRFLVTLIVLFLLLCFVLCCE